MIWLLVCMVIIPFGFVVLFGAPYLPTRKRFVHEALDMLDLKKGEILVDLGSGDGVVLQEAAKRGLICYGYELNPLLCVVAWVRTWHYRKNIHIICGNFWKRPLPRETKGVFVFLLDKYMKKLDKKLIHELNPGAKIVSYTFKIPHKHISHEKNGLHLYQY